MSQTKVATNFLGAGAVGQIVSVSKTDRFTTSSTSYTDITGFTASITPSATSSKILVISNWGWGSENAPYPRFILLRGSTSINIGDSSGSATQVSVANGYEGLGEGTLQNEPLMHNYLDSPSSTSSVTYKWQVKSFNAARTITVGGSPTTSDGNRFNFPTNITLMEILG